MELSNHSDQDDHHEHKDKKALFCNFELNKETIRQVNKFIMRQQIYEGW
jgi:hypothetical protein